jgi:GrpB-like predicted nucleotidyltransferase (UPF0157 family)
MDDERPPPPAPVPPDAGARVRLVRADAGWARRYATVAAELAAALGDALVEPGGTLLDVHHVGSTAVPGLLAKPTLDVMARLAAWPPPDDARRRLARLGYRDHGEAGEPGRRFFTRGGHVTHLHLVGPGGAQLHRHLAVRELLIRDGDARARYEARKRELVHRHAGRRRAYVQGKDEPVRALEAEALAGLASWLGEAPVRDLLARVVEAGVASSPRGGWCLGGGWALSLATGAARRLHDDVDVVLDRRVAGAWLGAMAASGVALGGAKGEAPWRPGDPLPPAPGGLMGRAGPLVASSPASGARRARDAAWRGPWLWDVALEERPPDAWALRGDPEVRRPLRRAVVERSLADAPAPALPLLAPEVVLLLKARRSGRPADDPKDVADLAAVAPRLAPEARAWLREALRRPPEHPWAERLAGA